MEGLNGMIGRFMIPALQMSFVIQITPALLPFPARRPSALPEFVVMLIAEIIVFILPAMLAVRLLDMDVLLVKELLIREQMFIQGQLLYIALALHLLVTVLKVHGVHGHYMLIAL
jgi:hypothetical protein